jgi:hypothetical protein
MMDLLGAGNPYIRRYAEGGEAAPVEGPKRYNTYDEFISDVVKRIPGVEDITADYRFLVSHETRPYMDQAIAEAKAKHDEELPALFEQAKQRELNRIIDEDFQKRAAPYLQMQQGALTATKPGDVFSFGYSPRFMSQYRVLQDGRLEQLGMDGNTTGSILGPEYRQEILGAIQMQLDASRKTAESLAPQTLSKILPEIDNQIADNYLKTVYEPFVDQRYRELLPRRTDIPFNQLDARLNELVTPYTNQLTRELFDQVRQEQQGIDAFILPQLLALNEEEQLKNPKGDDVVAAEYQRRREYLQNQARAMKEASQRKADYLFSPEYDLSKGPGELDRIYQEVLRQEMERLNPTLVPSVPSGGMTSPTVPSSPSVSPTPVAPRPPTVPAPVLPTPSSPTGNLLPQPLIGSSSVGIPRPGIGTSILPQYQSPTFQATQPTQQQQQPQQQIQYGPIGQGAVGQTNLLSTLLSQQQDPTNVSLLGFDNPYLMKPFG